MLHSEGSVERHCCYQNNWDRFLDHAEFAINYSWQQSIKATTAPPMPSVPAIATWDVWVCECTAGSELAEASMEHINESPLTSTTFLPTL